MRSTGPRGRASGGKIRFREGLSGEGLSGEGLFGVGGPRIGGPLTGLRSRLPTPLTSTSRRARWRRTRAARLLSAMLAGAAVWLIASQALPHEPEIGDPVVVVTRAVPIGATLTDDDLRIERRLTDQRPVESLTMVGAAIGRTAAGPLSKGEVLTPARLQGAAQLAALPAGRVAVSIPLVESGLLASIRPADVVEVLAAGTGQTVSSGATVLSVERPGDGVLGQGSDSPGHVVLALTPDEARAVAAAITSQTGPAGFVVALHRS